MKNESLADLAQRAIERVKEAKARATPYNDYGGVMGVCDEELELCELATHALRDVCRRARRLVRRIDKLENGNCSVTMLATQLDGDQPKVSLQEPRQ